MVSIPTSRREFTREFLERTRSNLLNSDDDFEMTSLINNCLGLVIFPFEFGRGNGRKPSVMSRNAKDISKEIGFRTVKFKPIKDLKNSKPIRYKENEKTLEILLEKIRNGLAHQNIRPRNNKGLFNEIVIWNVFKRGRQPHIFSEIDVRIIFNQEQLKRFALMIADNYIKKLSPKKKGKGII